MHSGVLDDGAGKPLQRRGRESHVMGGWPREGRHWDQGITTLSGDWDANAYGLISLGLKVDGGLCYNFKKVHVGFFVCLFLFAFTIFTGTYFSWCCFDLTSSNLEWVDARQLPVQFTCVDCKLPVSCMVHFNHTVAWVHIIY